jgi:hypothetical protein
MFPKPISLLDGGLISDDLKIFQDSDGSTKLAIIDILSQFRDI